MRIGEYKLRIPFVERLHLLGSPEADQALLRAWESGAKVEFIGEAAAAVLKEADGVGALLRY